MSNFPNWSENQFVDAAGTGGLNAAAGVVSGAMALLGSGAFALPGVLNPDAMGYSFTGLVASVSLAAPWALITSGGALIRAHGAVTGQNTINYSCDFTSLVPVTGSLTAYVACSGIVIQQNPFPLPGPPPGHPSYNPNYVPGIGYATNLDSVNVFATATPPDNLNIFTLIAVTLTAGSSAITLTQPQGQIRASTYKSLPYALVSGGALVPGQAQQLLIPNANNLTLTLPASYSCNGLMFSFLNTQSALTIAASGTDVIGGLYVGATSASISVPASGACSIYTQGDNIWRLVSANPLMVPVPVIVSGFAAAAGSGGASVVFTTPFPGIPSVKITPITPTSPLVGSSDIVTWALNQGTPTASGFVVWGAYWNGTTYANVTNQSFFWEATYIPPA
jgi:hypothetical protein